MIKTMVYLTSYLQNLLELCLAGAPWLVLGLIVGGLIKVIIPMSYLEKHLGGEDLGSIIKAALLGAPLPLCSCGVIPAALGLRKAGASKPATVSFMVSTPETGVDSVTVTYALLGPFMAVVRPIAAVVSAITAGLLVGRARSQTEERTDQITTSEGGSCCSTEKVEEPASCCSEDDHIEPENVLDNESLFGQIISGITYAFTELFSMLLFWLCIGLLFAAAVQTFVPSTFLTEWGSGLPAMLIMVVIGIPMYVCATSSTPIAAGFMLAGVSPGTALVFLMAGPATNISTLGVIGKELGRRSLIAYLIGVGVVAIIAGLITDFLVQKLQIDIQGQLQAGMEMVPNWLAITTLIILIVAAIWPAIESSLNSK
ncbi:MAG: SO_0444 family Cu/Zn efflux transporter [Gammaproteobacteria bacterium]